MEEGYTKFECRWTPAKLPALEQVAGLCIHRDRLHALGLIGVYEDGVGYGNLSVRFLGAGADAFLISGTQTGHIPETSEEHYSLVQAYSIEENWVECVGQLPASSESLTHAMLYQLCESIQAVVHVHHHGFWENLLDRLPTTSPTAAYGTPQMALEIQRLWEESDLSAQRILAMGGHEEGVISFGESLHEACETLLSYFETGS